MNEKICVSANKNDTLESIRSELRGQISFSRKRQRDLKINKNRLVLGELFDIGNAEDFIVLSAKSLRKKSLNIEKYKQLQNALIQSESHINEFFKVNAVQGLSRDLSGISIQSKMAAANCCCNLALGNSKACITICKFVAPYLINDLESTNQPLTEVCAWTIGNLVSKSNKAFFILHAQGCMKSLINLAKKSSNALLPAVSYASVRYIHTGVDFIEKSDIIRLGKIMVMRYSVASDIDTIWLLALLSSQSECNQDFMKCISKICINFSDSIFAGDENIEKISGTLRIICNLVTESSGLVAFYLFSNDIETNCTLLKKLLFHQYIHVRQETLWLLGNLYNHNVDSVQQMIKSIVFSLPSLVLTMNE